jgi:hypothetical protein
MAIVSADPRDDFRGFEGKEHMFFGLVDPFRIIRRDLEEGFAKQVQDTVVEAITMQGEPRFLTLGRRTSEDAMVIVTSFAFCLRAAVSVTYAGGERHETLPLHPVGGFAPCGSAGALPPAPPAGRCPCTPLGALPHVERRGRCPLHPQRGAAPAPRWGLCPMWYGGGVAPCTPSGALPLHPGQEKRG